jgi:hypothetical protein
MSSPWKPWSGRTVSRPNAQSEVSQWTYGSELRRVVQSVTGKFIFNNCLIAPISLSCSCFSRNRNNNKSFLSIRGYGASRKLHRGVLQPEWVKTHIDALLLLFLHCISILYISNIHILQFSWNTFWNYWELSFVKTCIG